MDEQRKKEKKKIKKKKNWRYPICTAILSNRAFAKKSLATFHRREKKYHYIFFHESNRERERGRDTSKVFFDDISHAFHLYVETRTQRATVVHDAYANALVCTWITKPSSAILLSPSYRIIMFVFHLSCLRLYLHHYQRDASRFSFSSYLTI